VDFLENLVEPGIAPGTSVGGPDKHAISYASCKSLIALEKYHLVFGGRGGVWEEEGEGMGSSTRCYPHFGTPSSSASVVTSAFSLAGKGRVVAEKRAKRSSFKTPFPRSLNAL
jgi:hypothetical protein